MLRALDELVVGGVETCAAFHRRVMEEEDFRAGRLSIRYLDDHPELTEIELGDAELRAVAVATALLEEEDRRRHRTPRLPGRRGEGVTAWKAGGLPGGDGGRRGRGWS